MSSITTNPATTNPVTTRPSVTIAPTQTSYVDVAGLMSILQNYLVNSPLVKNTNGDQIDTSIELSNINHNLNQISTAMSSNTSGNVLAQQSGVDSIVNNEMNRLNNKKQTIDSALSTQQRMMQMNDSYTKRQKEYTKMLVVVVVGIVVMIFMSYISVAFPEWSALATIVDILIIVSVFIFCFWTYYYLISRDPIYYDQLNIQQAPFPATNNGASGTVASSSSPHAMNAMDSSGTCVGPSCCSIADNTIWDSSHNVCVKESFAGKYTTVKKETLPYGPSEIGDYSPY
jgi:hypothetical protein